MARKQASHADYEVIVEDNGKIVVKQSGQVLPNAMGALRTIASAVGFAIEPKWNTQQTGSKLVDFLKNARAAEAPVDAKPQPAAAALKPAAVHKPAPVAQNNNKPKDEELTSEEMKQLDEILKRIESLEARLAKLEKAPAAATTAASGNREVIVDVKKTSDYTYYKTSEGRVLVRDSYGSGFVWCPGYLIGLKKILIEIGEEEAIDLSGFDDSSLEDARKKRTESYEKFIMQVTRLITKYGSKGSLPALLPNDAVLDSDGSYNNTSVSKKNIKF